MSSIRSGSDFIKNVLVGDSRAYAVYLGSTKIWPFTPITEENTNRTNYAVPSGTMGCYVTLVGGGGGGGAGNGGIGSDRPGGGGGGGAAVVQRSFVPIANLGTTYSVSVGSAGGAGTNGGNSTFSSGSVSISAGGGSAGANSPSTSVAGAGGAAGVASVSGVTGISTSNGTAGGAGGGLSLPGVAAVNNTSGGAPGGGGGGERNAFASPYAGGAGGNSIFVSGGAGAPATGGANGTSGNATSAGRPGGGGGGGAGNGYGAGGKGGNGGVYGAGGGGGGGGNTSGVGGSGAAGYTLIEWVGETYGEDGPPPNIVFDAVGTGGTNTSAGASSLQASGTHTCTGSVVVVSVIAAALTSVSSVSVTYGSQNMTLLGSDGEAQGMAYLFGLFSPPSGSQTVTATALGTSLLTVDVASVSYSGASSFGNFSSITGSSSSSASQTVSSSNGILIAQAFGTVLSSFSGYSQTQEISVTGTYATLVQGDASGAASVNFSASLSPASSWCGVAIELLE